MATGKRFYWMKLKESFMTSDTIDYFMSQPNGANYVVLYQMLCLKTINTAGRLERQIGEIIIPYDVDKIQRDCKWFSADTVRVALTLYRQVGLIYEDVDGTLVMADHDNLVGSETDAAARMRSSRANRNAATLPPVTDEEQRANIVTPDIRDMAQKMSKCRGCGRPIIFIKTVAGKQMPCDPRLVPFWHKAGASGKIVTIDGEVVSCELDGPRSTVSGCGYVSHFSTCPNADVFRSKK